MNEVKTQPSLSIVATPMIQVQPDRQPQLYVEPYPPDVEVNDFF